MVTHRNGRFCQLSREGYICLKSDIVMLYFLFIQVVAQLLGYVNTFERLPGVSIHWPYNGTVHPNKPPCGFTGELCSTFSEFVSSWQT